jgi:hypothetical protein
MLGGYCRGQPWGSPKTTRGILLKVYKEPKLNTSHLAHKQGTAHTAVVPAAHRSGPLKGPLEQVLPRSRVHTPLERVPPRSRVHGPLDQAPPRSRVRLRLARDSLTRMPIPARGYGHLMLWRGRAAPSCTWESCPGAVAPTPSGNPSPPLWGTVRHGQCQLRGTAPPTPVRLTCRALEGGRPHPRTAFS